MWEWCQSARDSQQESKYVYLPKRQTIHLMVYLRYATDSKLSIWPNSYKLQLNGKKNNNNIDLLHDLAIFCVK